MVYIRTGANNNGDIMYNSDGRYIRLGDYSKGDAMYNIDGKYVREGNYSNGSIMYNIDGNYIRIGSDPNGVIKYIKDGNYIRRGDYSDREIVYNITEKSSASGCFITTACIKYPRSAMNWKHSESLGIIGYQRMKMVQQK